MKLRTPSAGVYLGLAVSVSLAALAYAGITDARGLASFAQVAHARPLLQATATTTPSKDNTLYEHVSGSLSNGAGSHFFAGKTAIGSIRRGVIAFDIAGSIPAGSTIDSVSLTLNMSKTAFLTGQTIALHGLLADWGEGSSVAIGGEGGEGAGGPSTAGDATWIHRYYSTTAWASAGGEFSASASATMSVDVIGFYTWTSAQMASDVQAWLDSPSSNFGWILIGNEGTNVTAKRFDSKENATVGNRPVLEVQYSPTAPTGLSASDTPGDNGGSIDLAWTPSITSGVTEQRIYRGAGPGGPYSLEQTFFDNVTSVHTDTGLTDGVTYYYVVRAFDGTNESGDSNEASVTPVDNLPPAAPTGLSASDSPGDEGGAIDLSWSPSASGDVTEQRIYRGTMGGPYPVLVTTFFDNVANSHTDTGLTDGTTHYYVARAFDGTNESGDSNEASATSVDNLPPAAPTVLTAVDSPGDEGGAIDLSWSPSASGDVAEQRIYRGAGPGGPHSLEQTFFDNVTSVHMDTGLTDGVAYYYVVRAFDGTSESGDSNEASATSVDNLPPAAPTVLTAVDSPGDEGGAIDLSWSPSASGDVTEQRIYRGAGPGGPYSLEQTFFENVTGSHTDTSPTDGVTYYYVVRAFDGTNASGDSNEASATAVDNLPPAAPTVLTAVDSPGDEGGAIDLSWSPSASGDVAEQRIYRGAGPGGPYSLEQTFFDNVTSVHMDAGLTDGVTYYYVVRAFDGTNESGNSNESSATSVDNLPPAAPTWLTAVDSPGDEGGAIDLSWTPSASADATEQRVYRGISMGGPYPVLVTTFNDNVTSSHTDTGLTDGVTYYYVVRAFDGTNESGDSNEASATPVDNLPPTAPTLVSAVDSPGDEGGAIDLSWTPSAAGDVTEQRVYRGTTMGGPYPVLVTTFFDNATSSHTETGLTDGTTYYYVVRAFDGTSESGDSNESSATPVDDPPFAPTGLSAVDSPGDEGGAIDLSWTPSASGDVTEQRIYRGTSMGGPYPVLVTTFNDNVANSHTDTGLTDGTTYYYVARAFDGTSESGDSNEASATPVDNLPPAAPTVLTAVDRPGDEGGAIDLSWTPSAAGDVIEQRVYRGTMGGAYPVLVTTFNDNVTNSHADTGLTDGTTYYYVVRAFDGTSESGDSNEASATPVDNLPPAAPTGLGASDTPGDNGGSINLSWTPSASGDVAEQRIYRGTIPGGPYSLEQTFFDNVANSHTDTGLTAGVTYYYVVRAFDGTSESSDSNESSATPEATPPPVVPGLSPWGMIALGGLLAFVLLRSLRRSTSRRRL